MAAPSMMQLRHLVTQSAISERVVVVCRGSRGPMGRVAAAMAESPLVQRRETEPRAPKERVRRRTGMRRPGTMFSKAAARREYLAALSSWVAREFSSRQHLTTRDCRMGFQLGAVPWLIEGWLAGCWRGCMLEVRLLLRWGVSFVAVP